jgi:ADP-dependent NAD(P)H-hydrate dehydratase / NAD(P)H-hydrate epimerase
MTDTAATPRIPVLTADEARDLDERTFLTLDDSYTLMRRAALSAARWIARNTERDKRSASVFVGTGNNGGDGWLIASLLRQDGWTIRLRSAGDPRTDDARRAREEAVRLGVMAAPRGDELLVIDALLGTGSVGTPREAVATCMHEMRLAVARGAAVIAIDLPSALDATTGDDFGALRATHTLAFGSVKRAHLLRRDLVGEVHLLDIGLVDPLPYEPRLVGARDVRAWIPSLAPDAYKGDRARLAIVGGGNGMAGAVILAARGAHAAGVGMVRGDVAPMSALALQIAAPFATVHAWHNDDFSAIDCDWPNAMVIGPGLDGGAVADTLQSTHIRDSVTQLLNAYHGPVVIDAGALSAFASHADLLRDALAGRPALITPHLGEFRRLFPREEDAPPLSRFDDPSDLAHFIGATVLLKGVPTIIAGPDGARCVSAAGTTALAMGGSGDVLAGIAGALLAQGLSPMHAGAAAAWVHGTAAERATREQGGWRGVTMEMLLREISHVWPLLDAEVAADASELALLPAVPQR